MRHRTYNPHPLPVSGPEGRAPAPLPEGLGLALASLTAERAQSALATFTRRRQVELAGPTARGRRERAASHESSKSGRARETAPHDDFFKALSDGTRRDILRLLGRRERCVSDIVERLDSTQPAISRHLAVLREADLVTCERSGRHVIYRLSGKSLARAARSLFRTLCPD